MINKSIIICLLVIGTTGSDDMLLLKQWGNFSKAFDLINKGIENGKA